MDIFINILISISLVISILGYYRLCRNVLNLKQEFCLGFILCSFGSILTIFGIINLLFASALILYVAGFVLFIYYFVIKDKFNVKTMITKAYKDLTIGLIVFIFLSCFLLIRLSSQHFYFYDNFTHWGVALKKLYFDSKFPTSSDSIIKFQSYPMGSTVIVWYFLRFFKYSEGTALFFHSVINLSMGVAFFSFTKSKVTKSNVVGLLLSFIGTICMFSSNDVFFNGVYELTVDQILATIAFFAFMILMYYKDDLKRASILILPVLTLELSTKSSGIFFFLLIVGILFYMIIKSANTSKLILPCSIFALSPLLILLIWNIRIKLVFENASNSTHAVSKDYYSRVFGEKTPSDIRTITSLFLGSMSSNLFNLVLILLVILLAFIVFGNKDKNGNKLYFAETSIICLISYIAYQIGLYLMYVFSMPIEEAIELPCYFRYALTMDRFLFCVVILLLINAFNNGEIINTKNMSISLKKILAALSVLVVFILGFDSISALFTYSTYPDRKISKDKLEAIAKAYNVPQNQNLSYMVYVSDDPYNQGFDYIASTYIFFTPDVSVIYKEDIDQINMDKVKEFDYLVILYDDDDINKFLQDNSIQFSQFIETKNI